MKNLIQKYLNCIPLRSEELYNKFLHHKMSHEEMMANGFPLPDQESPGKVTLVANNLFAKPMNPGVQICRCGKEISMLEDNWYVDDDGCNYHLGKRVFCDGPENGLFNCCKKISPTEGCAFSKHHVSFHRPFEDIKFVQAEQKKGPLKHPSNIFALDCEMAFTTKGMELVKVSLIGINGDIVYDTYVLPEHPILDHNTAFSGVSDKDLRDIATNLEEVQVQLLRLLNKDSILIGHSVENDLLALNMVHENVVDTSCVFPHGRGFPLKNSLKHLAAIYLQKNIQDGYCGHNSIEDARTCMELVLWKIYSETRETFVAHPIAQLGTSSTIKCGVLEGPQSNDFSLKYPNIPFRPFKNSSVLPPSFVCVHVAMCPPVIPFFSAFCTSTCIFTSPDNRWWPGIQ